MERTTARTRVNQAPSGTLVRTDDKYAPSREAKMRKPAKTMKGLRRQMMRATSETMHVVMKVTRMTQTP